MKLKKIVLPLIFLVTGMFLSWWFCRMHWRPFYCCDEISNHPIVTDSMVHHVALPGCDTITPYSDSTGVRISSDEAMRMQDAFNQKVAPMGIPTKGGVMAKCLVYDVLRSLGTNQEMGYYFGYNEKTGNIVLMLKGLSSSGPGQESWYLCTGNDAYCPERCP